MSNSPIHCLVLGGGGHGKVVIDAMLGDASVSKIAIIDNAMSLKEKSLFGLPLLGGDEVLGKAQSSGYSHFVLGVGSLGFNRKRQDIYENALSHGLLPHTVIHPDATLSEHAEIGAGTVILGRSVINAGATIGCNAIINSSAIIEHDCRIGDHAHVAPGACVLGDVNVGSFTHVGAGAVIRQGIHIGDEVMIGAGAVVLHDVKDGETVSGVPARAHGNA